MKVGERPELFRLREWRGGQWQWLSLAPMTADDAVEAMVVMQYTIAAAHSLIDDACHQFASTLVGAGG